MKQLLSPRLLVPITNSQSQARPAALAREHTEVQYRALRLENKMLEQLSHFTFSLQTMVCYIKKKPANIRILIWPASFFPYQNFTQLKEMHLVSPACFRSCTKTDGLETAPHLIPQQGVLGVRLTQNLHMNSGDTAQLFVSKSIRSDWFHVIDIKLCITSCIESM